ncbi:MAG: DUF6569 family protein [Planctomycetaceae bacterium]
MTFAFAELVDQLELGERQTDERMTLIPLKWRTTSAQRAEPQLEYLTLEQAIEQKLARVMEVTESGSVPQMTVINEAKLPLFLPDGTTLIGCKQNRVVNISILLAAQSVTKIPVSCVERGRWQRFSAEAQVGDFCDPELRSRMARSAGASLKASGEVRADQGEVWSHVDRMLHASNCPSETNSYSEAFRSSRESIDHSLEKLSCPDGAVGLAVVIAGKLASVDLFDKPETLQRFWKRIVPGALMASRYLKPDTGDSIPDLLQTMADELQRPAPSGAKIGIGSHFELKGSKSLGTALVHEKQLLHLALFAAV